MADGGGKYGEHASRIFEETDALAVFLMVIKHDGESGVSLKAPDGFSIVLPNILRSLADQIEMENVLSGGSK